MLLTKQISITWDIDDILSVRPHLSPHQASQVLDFLEENHDASVGINWEVIEVVSDMLFLN